MQKMLFSLVLLASLLGSLAQEDLEGMAFVFPKESKTAYVVLNATVHAPLTSFTLCMRFYTDLTRECSLFSWASKRSANEIFLSRKQPNKYRFHLGDRHVDINVPEKFSAIPGREHVCVSWESSTGLVELWVNGQPLVQKSLAKGHSVSTEASIILGQDQDFFRGGFDIKQSFVGKITHMYMWDHFLSPKEVSHVWHNADISGNLINWKSLSYKINGDVIVKCLFSTKLGRCYKKCNTLF